MTVAIATRAPLSAHTYYVSAQAHASDSNPGTVDRPFASIGAALTVGDALSSGTAFNIEVGGGTFTYSSVLHLLRPYIQIRGQGMGVTILKPHNCDAMRFGQISGFKEGSWAKVCDLTIDGSDGATSGMRLSYATGVTFQNVEVTGCTGSPGHGFYGDGTSTYNWTKFVDCKSYYNAGNGFDLTETGGVDNANNCELHRCIASYNGSYGLAASGVSTRVYGGWYVNNTLMGVKFNGIGMFLSDPLIEANWPAGSGLYAWPVNSPGGAVIRGQRMFPTDTTTYPYMYQCVTAGNVGMSEPNWALADGLSETITDGTAVWKNIGPYDIQAGGPGIDDTGGHDLFYHYDNPYNQKFLGAGDSVSFYMNGGTLKVGGSQAASPGYVESLQLDGSSGRLVTSGIVSRPGAPTNPSVTHNVYFVPNVNVATVVTIPVTLSPTGGADALVQVYRASTNSGGFLGFTKEPAGGTSGRQQVMEFYVPAGWYLMVYLQNATIQTSGGAPGVTAQPL